MITILRWKGGYGGDCILSSILRQNPDIQSNITSLGELDNNSRVIANSIPMHPLQGLAYSGNNLRAYLENNKNQVSSKMKELDMSNDHHLLKTHNYECKTLFNGYKVIDIVSTNNLLTFTSYACFIKTYNVLLENFKNDPFGRLLIKSGDKQEIDRYLLYAIAVDHCRHNASSKKLSNTISLDDWVFNDKCNIGFSFNKSIRESWVNENSKFFPGSSFPALVTAKTISQGVVQGLSYNVIQKSLGNK